MSDGCVREQQESRIHRVISWVNKEQGDGFSDLKVQSVAVQSCFTNNRSQQ